MLQFKKLFYVILVLAVSVIAWSCAGSDRQQNAPAGGTGPNDEKAVRAQLMAMETAWNKRDIAALAGLYTSDGDFIYRDEPGNFGQDAIRRAAEAGSFFPTAPSAPDQISLTPDRIRFLSTDVAVVDATARFSAGEVAETRPTYVMVRGDGTWRIAAVRVLPAQKK